VELGSQLAMARTLGDTLSDEQLGELLGLIEDADSVELRLTVPASGHQMAIGVLGIDPLTPRSARSSSLTRPI
jgi:hypothetical protein